MIPIVRNISNGQLYRYNGNDEFENLITGKKGVVGEEKANKVFMFNLEATELINDHPIILELIKSLNLKVDK